MRQPSSPDLLREVFLERATLYGIERNVAESLFDTFTILHKPERKELPRAAKAIARSIDHTYLTVTPDNRFADVQNVVQLCREAGEWGTASVCVRPEQVALAKSLLDRWGVSDVAVCAVINFPKEKGGRGGIVPEKECVEEALRAQRDGATEFDVVMDYEALLRGFPQRAYYSITCVADAVKGNDPRAIVKAILETAALRDRGGGAPAIMAACTAAIAGGADYFKTSTGYAPEGGATAEDVIILHAEAELCGVLVEASGGITSLHDAILFLRLGASRLGMSTSVNVLKEALNSARNTAE